MKKTKQIFYTQKLLPPTQSCSLSFDQDQQGLAVTSHDQPRLETALPDGVNSYAADVGGWSSMYLKVELMPWQLHALHGQLAHVDGDFVHRVALTSTARQNGKTTALMALVGWWLTEMPKIRGQKQTVVTTAHRLDLAVMLYQALSPVLEEYFGAKCVNSYGRNQVTMPDGTRWLVRAANQSVGHGASIDLAIADEIWDITREAIDSGLIPAMRARRSPLLSMWSTAGTEASAAMMKWREQGLRAIDKNEATSFYFAEWSAPPDVNPMTPEAWAWSNPALGHTLEMSTIQAESENPDRAAFLRANNSWVATDRGWINPGLWSGLHYDGELPTGGTVAIETSMDDTRYFAVRCVALPDRRIVATVQFMADTFAECQAYCETLAANPQIKFAITPTVDLHWPTMLERRRVVVGYGEILKFTPAVKNMINEKLLWHTGEAHLAEHVNRAVAVRSQGSIALSSQRSPGPIELARCMVWAAALCSRPQVAGKPMMVVAS